MGSHALHLMKDTFGGGRYQMTWQTTDRPGQAKPDCLDRSLAGRICSPGCRVRHGSCARAWRGDRAGSDHR